MKTKAFFSVTIFATLLFCVQKASAQEFQDILQDIKPIAVEINGVIWLKTNVGADNPEDYGDYFTWEEAQTACPKYFRLPTIAELEMLGNMPSEWITINGVNGRRFGSRVCNGVVSSNSCVLFLPAAGLRNPNDDTLKGVGTYGSYWCITEGNNGNAYGLGFHKGGTFVNDGGKDYGCSVRCVAE